MSKPTSSRAGTLPSLSKTPEGTFPNLPLQLPSQEIWSQKYQLHDPSGNPIDADLEATFDRVAEVLANVETTPAGRKRWRAAFREAMAEGAVPAGRIVSNAGASAHKTAVSLVNCTVSGTVEDSLESILQMHTEAGMTLKAGCGIGYEFSTLRHTGAFVHGAGSTTSGPLSFMEIYDKMCYTIRSAGGRRGAQMATFDVEHPDTLAFIEAKRTAGAFRQFNLSLLITDKFMDAVHSDAPWEFKWQGKVVSTTQARELWDKIMRSNYDYAEPGFLLVDRINRFNNLWFCEHLRATNPCVTGDTLVLTDKGHKRIDSLVGKTVNAWNGFEFSAVTPRVTGENQEILDIVFSNGETLSCTPYHKFILDTGDRMEAHTLEVGDCLAKWELPANVGKKVFVSVVSITPRAELEAKVYCFTEPKRHTAVFNGIMTGNCGEQPLPPYGACLLGSIALFRFVVHPFTDRAYFDWARYRQAVAVFTRMLDNVVEISGLPLLQQVRELADKRRHGMGYIGLGTALTMLRIPYGSPESLDFTSQVTKEMAFESFLVGTELAQEKGEAPVLRRAFTHEQLLPYRGYNSNFSARCLNSGVKNRKSFSGRELLLDSHYFDAWREDSVGRDILSLIRKHGSRFTHATSIAPTGTISLSLGNNSSAGIEPSFSHSYTRNMIVEGRPTKVAVEVQSLELLAYRALVNPNATPEVGDDFEPTDSRLPSYFATASTLTPRQHVDVQAAAQQWVDSSISKTVNVPTAISFEDFKDVYTYAHSKGLKGCTTFRFNPENFQGVLVNNDDLAKTVYCFTLADGTEVKARGNELVEYEGHVHSAANLFDAIKEGTYRSPTTA